MPWTILALIADDLASTGLIEMPLVVLLMFVAYLRPGEDLLLPVFDCIPPSNSREPVEILLHSDEAGTASKVKVNAKNESLLLDSRTVPWLGEVLLELKGARSGNLFGATQSEVRDFFNKARLSRPYNSTRNTRCTDFDATGRRTTTGATSRRGKTSSAGVVGVPTRRS